MTNNEITAITVRIPTSLKRAVEAEVKADIEHRSVTHLIESLFRGYVAKRERQRRSAEPVEVTSESK